MNETSVLGYPPPLGELAAGGTLALFLDFDGTLVEIAPAPEQIQVPQGLAFALERLAERLCGRVALVSGRSTSNIGEYIGAPLVARAGSHGAERLRADGTRIGVDPIAIDPAVEIEVQEFAALHSGVRFERKPHGAALHFRGSPELEGESVAFAESVALRYGLWVKLGKCVAELVQPGADKAGAVQAFMGEEPFAGARPVFVGDDVTDEDGFRAATELGGFGVIVGDRPGTLARYRLSSPEEVHKWLEL